MMRSLCNYLVLTTNGQFIGNLRFWRFILYLSAAIDFCGNVPRKTWKQIFCKNTQVLRTRQYFRSNAIFVLHSWHIFRQTCHLPANEERRVNRALWTPHLPSPRGHPLDVSLRSLVYSLLFPDPVIREENEQRTDPRRPSDCRQSKVDSLPDRAPNFFSRGKV